MFKCRASRSQPDTQPNSCCSDPFLMRLRMIHGHHHRDFHRHHRNFRRLRPILLLFNLLLLYLLFTWLGFEGVALFLAALIIIKEVAHFFFLERFEKRIFVPLENLKLGIDEIANGNYNVKVNCAEPNDLSLLILSFNEMAQKLAESEQMQAEYEANRKELIANISHDLKTPITAIQGYIEALCDAQTPPTAQEKYLRTIHSNAIYINNLIDDLFLFSKLDMAKLEFCYAPVSIRPFLSDFMEEYEFDLREKGVSFQYCDALTQDYQIKIDGKRFHQAFNNLISNAVTHSTDGQLAIRVTVSAADNWLTLAVSDNGPGIPADQLPFIFDRFFRVDSERKKDYASTGLGLAIAKELIEAHGGTISVVSELGQGCCFSLRLPLSDALEQEAPL
ncbi:HAMP domain-containing sensor histidine kinase [Azotosporobacter soli]|uniref:sensor histidine kinase n=1 Tax=Azotosporobacter soli TaxID=3055040 RepID=UPI0031FF0857